MKRFSRALAIALLLILVTATVAMAAYSLQITVNETAGNTYTEFPINTYADVTTQRTAGFISATGLDTRVSEGVTELPHMLASDRILFTADIAAFGTSIFDYTAGNAPLSSFPVIIGNDGYITTADAAAIEIGTSFDIAIDGYFDTSAAMIGENILYKQDSVRIYVQAAGTIRAAILSAGDIEDKAVDGAVTSGEHVVRIYTSGSVLVFNLDGARIAETKLDTTVSVPVEADLSNNGGGYNQDNLHCNCFAAGRYWIFWTDNGSCVYQSSADGAAWTARATAATTGAGTQSMNWTDVHSDGSSIYISYKDSTGNNIYYRKGTLNPVGTITWVDAASVIAGTGTYSYTASIDTDSDGNVWALYTDSSDDKTYLDLCEQPASTWVSATGFPKLMIQDGSFHNRPVLAIADDYIYCQVGDNGTVNQEKGALFDLGTYTFGAIENTAFRNCWGLVSYGNDIWALDIDDIYKRTYGIGWGASTDLGTDPDTAKLSIDKSTGDMYCVRATLASDDVEYKRYDADTGTWDAGWTLISDESVDGLALNDCGLGLSATESNGSAYIVFTYMTATAGGEPEKEHAGAIILNNNPVPDTANDYIIMDANTVTYADEISFTINGSEALLYAPVTVVNSVGVDGIVDAGTDTTLDDATLTQADDYWNGARLVINTTTDGLAPKGETAIITDFDSANDRLVFAALSDSLDAGDTYSVDYGILPDLAGTAQDGRITWGVVPAGITVPAASPPPATSIVTDPGAAEGTALVSSAPDEPDSMYDEGSTGGLLGLGDIIDPALGETGTPVEVFWYPIAFVVSIVIGFAGFGLTKSLLMQAIISACVQAIFVGGGVLGPGLLPFWTVLVFLIEGILIWLISEKHGL